MEFIEERERGGGGERERGKEREGGREREAERERVRERQREVREGGGKNLRKLSG